MPLPKEVNERIEEELRYVSESDVFKMMLIISDVFKGMRIATENMPVIGYCEGFFLAYLLGITRKHFARRPIHLSAGRIYPVGGKEDDGARLLVWGMFSTHHKKYK